MIELLYTLVGAALLGGGFAAGWYIRGPRPVSERTAKPRASVSWNPRDMLRPTSDMEPITPEIQREERGRRRRTVREE